LLADERGKTATPEGRWLENWDRGSAAAALGLMGAKEYAPKLVALLHSASEDDRVGAASGLSGMGSAEHVAEIAKLLDDKADRVRVAAMQALGALGAKQYAGQIAALLTALGDPMVGETACYTLVKLNAKEQTKDLAKLLGAEFQNGYAAKALALLGAVEYAQDIAALLEDKRSLVRCDALIALGILEAKQYTKNVAAHLDDKEEYVRAYAAVSLLLMDDRTHAKKVLDVVQSEWKDPDIARDNLDTARYFGGRIKLHPAVSKRQQQLTLRAKEAWDRLNPPGK
jgi:HEAT repeat protein